MRVGVCQLEAKYDDFAGNFAKLVAHLERADRERVDLLCFPECFLTGYPDDAARARATAFPMDSPQVMKLLDASQRFRGTFVVGFNEKRGEDLFNTAIVLHKGHILGSYSKCTAYMKFHRQGREFPVFDCNGTKFGIVICSDGGFIEPARILAAKGAKIILSPHYNYIGAQGVIGHFMKVRADHIARAVENGVYFVRANSVSLGKDPSISGYEGVGYGDSYIVDPHGEVLTRSRRHVEDFFFMDLDLSFTDRSWGVGRSLYSHREFGEMLRQAAESATKKP